MLTKRIIPCLDVKDGRVVKGTSFIQLRDAGDPVELAAFYYQQGADELVFLDISATPEGRDTLVDVVERISETQAQLEILRREGCDEMQGYLFGRPQPIAEYSDMIGRSARDRRATAAG